LAVAKRHKKTSNNNEANDDFLLKILYRNDSLNSQKGTQCRVYSSATDRTSTARRSSDLQHNEHYSHKLLCFVFLMPVLTERHLAKAINKSSSHSAHRHRQTDIKTVSIA